MILELTLPFLWGGIMLGWYSLYTAHVAAALVPTILLCIVIVVMEFRNRRNKRLAKMATKSPPGKCARHIGAPPAV
jgi:hypothetical protein